MNLPVSPQMNVPVSPQVSDAALVFDNVSCGYGDTIIVRGVSGRVAAGRVLGTQKLIPEGIARSFQKIMNKHREVRHGLFLLRY